MYLLNAVTSSTWGRCGSQPPTLPLVSSPDYTGIYANYGSGKNISNVPTSSDIQFFFSFSRYHEYDVTIIGKKHYILSTFWAGRMCFGMEATPSYSALESC